MGEIIDPNTGHPVIEKGQRFHLIGSHPWAGRCGTFVEFRDTMLGPRPVIRLDDADDVPYGQEVFIMRPGEGVFV